MSDIATVKVELSDEQMDVLLRDIGDLTVRVDVLEQRISDVNEAALYDYAQAERRIDALERKLNHKGGDERWKNGLERSRHEHN